MENLSDKKVKEYKETFDLFDKNGDGYICKKELATCVHYFGLKYSDKELDEHVKEYDSDGNGRIDFKEYLTVVSDPSRATKMGKAEITAAFETFDMNQDGFVSAQELSDAMRTLGNKMSVPEVRQMLREADFNKDGKIDYSEFTTMMFS